MSSLVTTMIQDTGDFDIYFVYNLGDGSCSERPSYKEYHRLAAKFGVNQQLSPFDARVRSVCQIRHDRIHELEFENDHTLDSGVWYKFIRTGLWRQYHYVLFLGEGTLLTRTSVLSAFLDFASRQNAHFIASGHEKRRLPRDRFLHYHTSSGGASPIETFHDEMVREVFAVFCRDPEFRRVFQSWAPATPAETENHVPDIWHNGSLWARIRDAAYGQGSDASTGLRRYTKRLLRCGSSAVFHVDATLLALRRQYHRVRSAGYDGLDDGGRESRPDSVHVNSVRRPAAEVAPGLLQGDVRFHEARDPAWFGCATNHFFSREFLERLAERLDRHRIYDALELPFAGSALEVVWGLLPAWLGFEKWFTDAVHRVRKNFVSYVREDDPVGMAWYINRYHRGSLYVGYHGDRMKVKAVRGAAKPLRWRLNEHYF